MIGNYRSAWQSSTESVQAMRTLSIYVCCFVINKICGQNILESYFQQIKACGENYVFPVSSSVRELNSKISKSESVIFCASMCLKLSLCDGINFCKNGTDTFCQSLDIQNPMSCGDIEERDNCNFLVKADSINNIMVFQPPIEDSTFSTASLTEVSVTEDSTFSTTSLTEVSITEDSTFSTPSLTEVSTTEDSTFSTTSLTEVSKTEDSTFSTTSLTEVSTTEDSTVSTTSLTEVSTTEDSTFSTTSLTEVSITEDSTFSTPSLTEVSTTEDSTFSTPSLIEVSITGDLTVSTTSLTEVSITEDSTFSTPSLTEVSTTEDSTFSPTSLTEVSTTEDSTFSTTSLTEVSITEDSTFSTTSLTEVSITEDSTFSTPSLTEVSITEDSTFSTPSLTEVSITEDSTFSTPPLTEVSITGDLTVSTTSLTEVSYDPFFPWQGDCSSIYGGNLATSNVYTIQPPGALTSFPVVCDVKQDGVYTRIMEHGGTCGVDDWNLPMSDYIVGFGQTVSCDHWIGLRNMLYLTQSGGTYKLEVNIELQDGNTDSVYYEYFYIKDQSEWTLRLDNFNGSTNNFLGNGFSNPPTSSDADLIDNEDFEGSGVNIYGCSGGDKSGWWFDEFCTNPNLCLPLGPVEEALYPSVRKLKWPDRFGNEYLVKRVNMQIRRAT